MAESWIDAADERVQSGEAEGRTFQQVYELSADKFINVALWKSEP